MTAETNKIISDDLRAAEPRMHPAVASQVQVYTKYDLLNMDSDQRAQVLTAAERLYDLCASYR